MGLKYYIDIYIYMCVCVRACAHVHVHVCAYMYIYMLPPLKSNPSFATVKDDSNFTIYLSSTNMCIYFFFLIQDKIIL